MYFLFVFHILRMFTVAIWAISSIPRGILNGIISGFKKTGFDDQAAKIRKSIDSAGIKEIFFDSIAEIFDQSDDEDELGPTGAPANRDQYNSRLLYKMSHSIQNRILTVKLKIPGKSMGKAEYRNFVTFKL